jgi:geranylgeranyl reductase family protein
MKTDTVKTKILIIGAGPAGSTLAYQLAQLNHEVILIDKAKFPRTKTCGGGIPLRTRKELNVSYEHLIQGTVKHTTLRAGLGQEVTFSGSTMADIVDRTDFDNCLMEHARSAGAEILENTEFLSMERTQTGWKVTTNKQTIQCEVLAACDGVLSRVRRSAGKGTNAMGIALEGYIPLLPNDTPKQTETAVFDFSCERHGYGWIFPRRTELAVGIGTSRWSAPDLRNRFISFASRIPGNSSPVTRITGAPIPRYQEPEAWYAKDNLYFLGDAAGLVDPLTGEGIYYAIKSANLAAEAIHQNNQDLYNNTILESICPELSIAAYFAKRRAQMPAWLIGIGLRFKRLRQYGEAFTRLLAGELSYTELYAMTHKGRKL